MSTQSPVMKAWAKCSGLPAGKWLFSRIVGWKAPYFASISPQFTDLKPGYCEVRIKKKRKVLNHIGTVHAIAMCNMAELVAGTVTDASIPKTHRWIPKGMQVDYLAKAETDLRAMASLDLKDGLSGSAEMPVTVDVVDAANQRVASATITMWVTEKSPAA